MSRDKLPKELTRRDFIRLGGGLIGAMAGSAMLSKAILQPEKVVRASAPLRIDRSKPLGGILNAQAAQMEANKHFIASDGWVHLPVDPTAPPSPYHPDNQAPDPFNAYIFGFRDVTGFNDDQVHAQKMKAQLPGPIFWLDEGVDFTLKLTNLGLQIRPDLIDAHTLHFHGFRNALPIFDGEPHSSVGIPIIRDLTYFYRPHDPGTYMYHCHFEETEHVHMGMVGPVHIRPKQNHGNPDLGIPAGKYVYNDDVPPGHPTSTAYDREFHMCLYEVWSEAHWCDSHIQLPDWTDYKPDYFLLNGRCYPDTLAPNGAGSDVNGDLIPPQATEGFEDQDYLDQLKYQPVSSAIKVNEEDRVLLRFANISYTQQTFLLTAAKMRIVGRDAVMLRGRDGTNNSMISNYITMGTGESADVIFVAPAYKPEAKGYNTYLLYNRNYSRLNNGGGKQQGGQMTEVHVYPAGTLVEQVEPNDWCLPV